MMCVLMALPMGACKDAGEEDMSDGLIQNVQNETKETAHVILLAGQSNAAGMSYTQYLQKTFSQEQITEYTNGYENVKISYYVDNENISSEFVPVALGQGHSKEQFGPEVGIAAYLSKTYPSEKFYIIKVAIGGSSIAADWQEDDECYNKMITGIDNAFERLEKDGFEPEWFATCWMQGECDAFDISRANDYYNLQADLMDRLQTRFEKYVSAQGVALVDAGISQFSEWEYHELVNTAKQKYAADNAGNFYLDTQGEGLTFDQDNMDYAHYDAASMIRLGEMFAEKIAQTVKDRGYVK